MNESPVVIDAAKCQQATLGLAVCNGGGSAALAVRLYWTREGQTLTPELSTAPSIPPSCLPLPPTPEAPVAVFRASVDVSHLLS